MSRLCEARLATEVKCSDTHCTIVIVIAWHYSSTHCVQRVHCMDTCESARANI
nr:MAG TPA: hypothetical protein [Caudoviricetes sp.]